MSIDVCYNLASSHVTLPLLFYLQVSTFLIPQDLCFIRNNLHDVGEQDCSGQGKNLENEIFSRSGKSQGILLIVREI